MRHQTQICLTSNLRELVLCLDRSIWISTDSTEIGIRAILLSILCGILKLLQEESYHFTIFNVELGLAWLLLKHRHVLVAVLLEVLVASFVRLEEFEHQLIRRVIAEVEEPINFGGASNFFEKLLDKCDLINDDWFDGKVAVTVLDLNLIAFDCSLYHIV